MVGVEFGAECEQHDGSTVAAVRRVLVVEDTETTRHRMVAVLRGQGYHVVEAIDGSDALRKLSAARFDAILLDLVMPRVDGWQFRAAQLRNPNLASIPTIIVTVRPLLEPDRYALRADQIVHKPFEDVTLLAALDNALRPRPAGRQPLSRRPAIPLFWSKRGEVACAEHAPASDSERWKNEQWAAMSPDTARHRIMYQCQHCGDYDGPIDRSGRDHYRKV